ncbi:ABC transporter ATP-binding protein [Limibacterium fermenti]|uniref:ABC transporter ATP-binding protein n=1 Tax=Limibacterium fermenti TaxID=3229863 RepID=UPI000E925AF4|nr:ABC transporter ATP-binding protein [Porphyromonadaceae bacterium]HBX45746.1 ABC transporter ATP-binding protein [Porphyromonadaceae bacterium]
MKSQKQSSTLARLRSYMGKKGVLMPFSITFSVLGNILGMLPFVCVWLIIRALFTQGLAASGSDIVRYAWWAFGFSILFILCYFTSLMLSHLAAFRLERNLRYEAMQRAVRMPLGFFTRNTTGKMRKVIDDNAGIVHTFVAHQLPDLAGGLTVFVATLVLMFVFDWRLGLACLVPLLIAFAQFYRMMGKDYGATMQQYMTSLEAMNTEAVEYVRGIPVVKVFQQTVYSFKRLYDSIMAYNKWVKEYAASMCKAMSIYTVAINGFAFLLVPAAIILILIGGSWQEITLNLIFYVLITPFFGQCIMKLMYVVDGYRQAGEAVGRIEALTDERQQLQTPRALTMPDTYDICFKQVSFRYDDASKEALSDVDLSIPQGKTVALVGASGSGKTTLARLIARFWDAGSGKVTIGGVDVKQLHPDELMRHISFVFQNTELFKTSIRENILYGKPDAAPGEIDRAVELAQCRDIIGKLPAGIDTKIGTEGIYLSGGEQQRIALARAFLKDAPIVLLDEATAFADPENEHEIQHALRRLMRGKTVVMIAHRLTSVTDADTIVVMDEGRIAEQGTHAQLLEKDGIYRRMWKEYQQSVRWAI